MFTLDEYKEDLVSFYRWGMDASDEQKKYRAELLNRNYSDSYLLDIIHNTENFIYYLFTKMKEENNTFNQHIFTSIELDEECALGYCKSVQLNLGGGWASDTLFYIQDKDKLISNHLLHKFLKSFQIYSDSIDYQEYYEDENVGTLFSRYFLRISCSVDDFEKMYYQVMDNQRSSLCRVLKNVYQEKRGYYDTRGKISF